MRQAGIGILLAGALAGLGLAAPAARAQSGSPEPATRPAATQPATQPAVTLPDLQDRQTASAVVQWLVIVTVVTVAPAVAVLVTSFTRLVVVLGLLRQGLGTPQLPPNTVLFGLAMLVSLVVMAPVLSGLWNDAAEPYLQGRADTAEAIERGEAHVRRFMITQVESAGHTEDVYLFLNEATATREDLAWADVPTSALLPAFVISELKVAFVLGFQILLPFLVIDLLTAAVLTSMGMLMLPPVLVSLPLKLLLFVSADGWHRVVGNLMQSFGPVGGAA